MTKPRLILDQDDVLADTHGKLADIVLREFDTQLTSEELHQDSFYETLSQADQKRLYKILHEPGFFSDIPLIPNAQEAVLELSKKIRNFCGNSSDGISQLIPRKVRLASPSFWVYFLVKHRFLWR